MDRNEIMQAILDFCLENEFYIINDVPDQGEIGSINLDFYNGSIHLSEPFENEIENINPN